MTRKPRPGSNDPPHAPPTPQSADQVARLITVAEAEALAADPAGLYKAEWLLAAVRALRGIACASCGGHGSRAYGSTATWRGGAGGQTITSDVCDKCWGSGLRDRPYPSHRNVAKKGDAEIPLWKHLYVEGAHDPARGQRDLGPGNRCQVCGLDARNTVHEA